MLYLVELILIGIAAIAHLCNDSKIVKNIDTDKIHNLFYQAHKEVQKIDRWEGKDISIDGAVNTYNPPDLRIKVAKSLQIC